MKLFKLILILAFTTLTLSSYAGKLFIAGGDVLSKGETLLIKDVHANPVKSGHFILSVNVEGYDYYINFVNDSGEYIKYDYVNARELRKDLMGDLVITCALKGRRESPFKTCQMVNRLYNTSGNGI